MTIPPRRIDLKLIDENYQLPESPTEEDKKRHFYAAAIREGIRRQKAKHESALEAMAKAQGDEMARVREAEREHGHAMQRLAVRHGRWFGGALGLTVGAALASIAILAMQGVIWDTAAQNFREQAMTGALLRANEQ